MYRNAAVLICLAAAPALAGWTTVDFEDQVLAPDSFYNGSDQAGGFTSHQVDLLNTYSTDFGGWWQGFALSNVQDNTTPGYANQYAAYSDPAGGYGGSGNYAVGYDAGAGATLNLPAPTTVRGALFTNTTYTGLSIRDGDMFTDPFGGPDGTEPDWFLLTVTGHDAPGASGNITGQVTFYLADYSNPFSGNRIVDDWTWLNLQPLGDDVASLSFAMASSDVSDWGINTPTYFALDNLVYDNTNIPEPSMLALLGAGGLLVIRRRRR